MLLLYNVGLKFYFAVIWLASFFNSKAKKWIDGRRGQFYEKFDKSVWFHFASLGEFEQGRPVLEKFREQHPAEKIVITFFSPSGYEIRKNSPLADAVYYLPLDTRKNAKEFVEAIKPTVAIFTKYEYWYYFFSELNTRSIPLYMISAIFRPEQVFFKWYGGLHRKILTYVAHFFVQDEKSKLLLAEIAINEVSVSGDTRFDRVWANAQYPKNLPLINKFKADTSLFIAGSTWPADEKLLAELTSNYTDWKFIFAPHEIGEEKIDLLLKLLPEKSAIRYSQITDDTALDTFQTLIIDNIGMLSSLYQYGEIAYIGGGFGVGIHNTLEAAAFGLPVIFGPNYARFKEACDLVELKLGFTIDSSETLKAVVAPLTDASNRAIIGKNIKRYVEEHTGATEMITTFIDL